MGCLFWCNAESALSASNLARGVSLDIFGPNRILVESVFIDAETDEEKPLCLA
jgi:hypothetical protein